MDHKQKIKELRAEIEGLRVEIEELEGYCAPPEKMIMGACQNLGVVFIGNMREGFFDKWEKEIDLLKSQRFNDNK